MFWYTMQLTTMRQVLLPVFVAVFTWIIYKVLTIGRRDRNLPSRRWSRATVCRIGSTHRSDLKMLLTGPPTLPIIGNAHLIPRKGAHFVYECYYLVRPKHKNHRTDW